MQTRDSEVYSVLLCAEGLHSLSDTQAASHAIYFLKKPKVVSKNSRTHSGICGKHCKMDSQ
jgi:hypothetical protein